jgi:hypothetical protein
MNFFTETDKTAGSVISMAANADENNGKDHPT